jgi:hypothetical protein
MKLSGTIVSIIGAVAVLAGAFAIGLGIREVRTRRARVEPKVTVEPDREQVDEKPAPGPGGKQAVRDLSPEQRAKRRQEQEKMMKKMANMSEEEKEKFKAQLGERFGAMRRGDGRRQPDLSPGQRARRAAEWEKMREKWESMSEQEKEQFKARMRERSGSGQPGDRPRRRGPSLEEGARRREQSENVSEE